MTQILPALTAQPLWLLALPLLAVLFFLAGRGPRRRDRPRGAPEGLAETAEPYRAYPVLNASERRLWAEMERILHDHFHNRCRILAQVALPEFVHAAAKGDFYAISGQRVDFLVVDAGFRPVCAIEYQGAGHYGRSPQARGRTRVRDFTKRKALRLAGVPLVEIPEHWDTALLRDKLGDVTGRREGQAHRPAPSPAGQRARA